MREPEDRHGRKGGVAAAQKKFPACGARSAGTREQCVFFRYAHRPDIADFLIIDVRFEPVPIIDFILDDSGDDQTPAAQASDLDGQMDTLIRVNPAEED